MNFLLISGKGAFVVFLVIYFASCRLLYAGNLHQPADSSRSEQPQHKVTPYESNRTVGQHLLAFPSYLLHWVTRPVGMGIKFAEVKLPQLLQGERGPYGVYPLFELGGNTGAAYGLLLYHNRFLPYNHRVRLEALFGSRRYNDFDFSYEIPGFIDQSGTLELDATYANDPEESLFGGNRSETTDQKFYATEEIGTSAEYRRIVSQSVTFGFTGEYRLTRVMQSESSEENLQRLIPTGFTGTTSLVTTGATLNFDFAGGTPRINGGSRYRFRLNWNRSLTNDRFRFLKYTAEWNQFVPLFFLPDTRRLAFKGRLQKVAPLADRAIPFYENPSLGSPYDLRGFSSDRFRDDGSLLLTLEYRYPIWNFADAVLFVDEGQVFNDYADIGIKDFNTSYGFGFHLISSKGFAFRTEFAFSSETSRVILSINPNF
ncbi:MAG: BamA/TamA family outer membrane protein [Balneolaceae bacterium]|nr:BamA/TamA family outer membrane protein [Balneolaceae bacterium]